MIQTKDNAYAEIVTTIADTDTNPLSISVNSGHGSRFSTLGSDDFMLLALVNEPPNKVEILLCYARSSDTFTCLRARNGSTAQDWASGDRLIQISDTTSVWAEHQDILGLKGTSAASGTNTVTASVASQHRALADKMRFRVLAAGANTGAMTLAITFDHSTFGGTTYATSAKDITDVTGAALLPGAVPAAGYPMDLIYRSAADDYLLINPAYPLRMATAARGVADASVELYGGSAADLGARLELYGESHPTLDNVARVYADEFRALVTDLFDVSDDVGTSLFRVDDDGGVTGSVLADRAQVHSRAATKLLNAENARNLPEWPKNSYGFVRTGGATFTEYLDEGHGTVSVSYDGSTWINFQFANSFNNTSYKGYLLTGGNLYLLGENAGEFDVVDSDTCRVLASLISINVPVLMVIWGEKFSL